MACASVGEGLTYLDSFFREAFPLVALNSEPRGDEMRLEFALSGGVEQGDDSAVRHILWSVMLLVARELEAPTRQQSSVATVAVPKSQREEAPQPRRAPGPHPWSCRS